jgi:hypothetical protein
MDFFQMIVLIQFTDREGRITLCGQVYRHCRSNRFDIVVVSKVIRNGRVFEQKVTKMSLMPFAMDPKAAVYLQDEIELD